MIQLTEDLRIKFEHESVVLEQLVSVIAKETKEIKKEWKVQGISVLLEAQLNNLLKST